MSQDALRNPGGKVKSINKCNGIRADISKNNEDFFNHLSWLPGKYIYYYTY